MLALNESLLTSGLDSMLVALPAFIVLLAGVFRIDELIATPRIPTGHADQLPDSTRKASPSCSIRTGVLPALLQFKSNQIGSIFGSLRHCSTGFLARFRQQFRRNIDP